jgi:hypothetical protein
VTSTQTKHPEAKPGETFLTNCSCEEDYDEIEWLSKRRGASAYDITGRLIPGYVPVFVHTSELERHGITLT